MFSFFNNQLCIFVAKHEVLVKPMKGKQSTFKHFTWEGVELLEVFNQIKQDYSSNSCSLLVSDSFSYIGVVENTESGITRSRAAQIISKHVPEEIEGSNFDWKLYLDTKHQTSFIEYIAVPKWIVESLRTIQKAGWKIHHLQLLAQAITASVTNISVPHLIISSSIEPIMILADKDMIYLTQSFTATSFKDLPQIIQFFSKKYHLNIQTLLLDQESTIDTQPFAGWHIKQFDLNLCAQLHQQSKNGADKDVLALQLASTQAIKSEPTQKQAAKTQVSNKPSSQRTKLLFVVFMLVFSCSSAFMYLYKDRVNRVLFSSDTSTQQQKSLQAVVDTPKGASDSAQLQTATGSAQPLPTASTSARQIVQHASGSATPAPLSDDDIDLSQYQLEVLNGSGRAGEAQYVADILRAEGFEQVTRGNADSYSYTNTVIQLKTETPTLVKETLDRALNGDYTLEFDDTRLTSNSEYDVVVTVGNRINN